MMSNEKEQNKIRSAFSSYWRKKLKKEKSIRYGTFETRKYKFDYRGLDKSRAHEGNSKIYRVTDKTTGKRCTMIYHDYRSFIFYEFK